MSSTTETVVPPPSVSVDVIKNVSTLPSSLPAVSVSVGVGGAAVNNENSKPQDFTQQAASAGDHTEHLLYHQHVLPVADIIGKWTGHGVGIYPTIRQFEYEEEVNFSHSGKIFVSYSQQTWTKGRGVPLHAESGFIRFLADHKVECIISQCTGVQETLEGKWYIEEKANQGKDIVVIDLTGTNMSRTSSARSPHVTGITRKWRISGAQMSYEVGMATSSHPEMADHLKAVLIKQKPDLAYFAIGSQQPKISTNF